MMLVLKKTTLVFLLCLPFVGAGQSSFPFQLRPARESFIWGATGGVNAAGIILTLENKPFSVNGINALRRDHIRFAFDRKATYNWSPRSATISDILMYGAYTAPMWLGWSPIFRQKSNAGTMTVMAAQTFLLSAGITNVVKNSVRRPRPFLYNPDAPLAPKLERDGRQSFFSGHTSTTAALCFFTAQTYAKVYPQARSKYVVWGAAIVLPALTGFYRIKAGKHFPSDVVVGYTVGALTGLAVPYWHL
jgi:membrane-associated phospholipid phosphatase